MRVLHPGQEKTEHQEKAPETASTQITDEVENPIGELQELCQKQQISMPIYEFEEMAEGFRCTVNAMGLQGVGEGRSKKEAKVGAARGLSEALESIKKESGGGCIYE